VSVKKTESQNLRKQFTPQVTEENDYTQIDKKDSKHFNNELQNHEKETWNAKIHGHDLPSKTSSFLIQKENFHHSNKSQKCYGNFYTNSGSL
jgi:hypothetical protein